MGDSIVAPYLIIIFTENTHVLRTFFHEFDHDSHAFMLGFKNVEEYLLFLQLNFKRKFLIFNKFER